MTAQGLYLPHLYFHRVADGDSHYTNIAPGLFSDMLDVLTVHCMTVSLSEALAMTQDKTLADEANIRKKILLSFDDGFADVLEFAVPALLERGLKAAFFVIPGALGRAANWGHYAGFSDPPWLMTLSQVRDLMELGFEIGAHGMHHIALTERSDEQLKTEIKDSRALLEDSLGAAVRFFSFPFGKYDRRSLRITMNTYEASFSTVRSQIRNWYPAPHALRRTYFRHKSPPETVLEIIDAFSLGDYHAG